MSRIARLMSAVFSRPNLIDSGTNYSNWIIAGGGTTKGANGIHLVQDKQDDRASIPIFNPKPSTVYSIVYTVTETNLNGDFAILDAPADNTTLLIEALPIPKSLGRNVVTITSRANTPTNARLVLVCTKLNSARTYINFCDVAVYEDVL